MNSFFQLVFKTLLLSKGPQDYPYSTVLMRLCLLAYFVTGLPTLMARLSFEKAVLVMVLDISVMLLFVYACLQAFSKSSRYVQSITTLMAVGVFFQIVMYPLLSRFSIETKPDDSILSLILVFAIWMFAVFSHIFKESFSIRMPAAIILLICYGFISQILSLMLFPDMNQ